MNLFSVGVSITAGNDKSNNVELQKQSSVFSLIISSVEKEHLMVLRHPLEDGEVYQRALRVRTSVTVKRAKWSHPSSWGGFKVQKCMLSSESVASSHSTFRFISIFMHRLLSCCKNLKGFG
jgi:hypothetical protein